MNINEDNFSKVREVETVLVHGEFYQNYTPWISIIIPTFKRCELLKSAIGSSLNQIGVSNYEVIVIDNDDDRIEPSATEVYIKTITDEKLKYYQNTKNLGMTGNWNKGIELARGEWITILHDDDMLYPEFLMSIKPYIDETPLDLLCTSVEVGRIINSGPSGSNRIVKIDLSRLIRGTISPAPGIVFRKEHATILGGFNPAYYPVMDYEFWSRYCMNYRGFQLKKRLAFYRISENESIKTETQLAIVRGAFLLKKDLINYSIFLKYFRKIILTASILPLIKRYSNNPEFTKAFKENDYCDIVKKSIFSIDNKYFYRFVMLVSKCILSFESKWSD